MRNRPPATAEQRTELLASFARILRPEVSLAMARSYLDAEFAPESVECALQSVRPDRFVLRAQVRARSGESRTFAWKVYADDFGARVWELARSLAKEDPSDHHGLCLPDHYLDRERTLVFTWVDGNRLSDIVDERKPALLQRAARVAARFHRTPVNGAPTLTPDSVISETVARSMRLLERLPLMFASLAPLMSVMVRAATALDPAPPALVHGDLAAGQFVWTGDRLVLLDLDEVVRSDAAYDVGHFMGQLERRCVRDQTLPEHAKDWVECFREAYAEANPAISWRNVSFYHGITLIRKMYTVSFRDPAEGTGLAAALGERARAAFERVAASG